MAKLERKEYWVKMRLGTENVIRACTVERFVEYLMANGTVEEEAGEWSHIYVDKKIRKAKTYDMGGDEFMVTTENRVFYTPTLNTRIEIVNE